MKPAIAATADNLQMLANKAAHGQPCTKCGLCCVATLCNLGQQLFQRPPFPGPCPALQKKDDGTYECGVLANPAKYRPDRTRAVGPEAMQSAVEALIGADLGCDARFGGEPADGHFYATLQRWDQANAGRVRAAKRLWSIK